MNIIKQLIKLNTFKYLITICLSISNTLFCQTNAKELLKENITPKLFIESYLGFNTLKMSDDQRPDFTYNHRRLGEIALNAAVFGLALDYRRVRSSISLVTGNYATYNLAAEPEGLNLIYEANVGVKLLKHHNLWLDAGIMESNLGFESVISTSNSSLSRSLLAEGSPYYLNAAKLSYQPHNDHWSFELLLSNGWQKMTNGELSLGHTIQYMPNEKWILNSSSFFNEYLYLDEEGSFDKELFQRFFHNFYVQRKSEQLIFTLGVDYGIDISKLTVATYNWQAYIGEVEFYLSPRLSTTLRGEYFSDPFERASSFPGNASLQMLSTSASFNIAFLDIGKFRLEGRYMRNIDQPAGFPQPINPTETEEDFLFVMASLSIDLWD